MPTVTPARPVLILLIFIAKASKEIVVKVKVVKNEILHKARPTSS